MTDFTTPVTAVTGLDMTPSIWNQKVRDNFLNLDERSTVIETAIDGGNTTRSILMQIVGEDIDVDTTSGIKYVFIPVSMNTFVLYSVIAFTNNPGTTNATTIQVRNMTKYSANDALSSAMSIGSGLWSSTGGAINTSYDDVASNDKIKIYVTGNSTTKAKGLYVTLNYVPA